jgi:hypothetical protein
MPNDSAPTANLTRILFERASESWRSSRLTPEGRWSRATPMNERFFNKNMQIMAALIRGLSTRLATVLAKHFGGDEARARAWLGKMVEEEIAPLPKPNLGPPPMASTASCCRYGTDACG